MKTFKSYDCAAVGRLQSQTISLLRFPLIVAVVMIHSGLDDVVVRGVNVTSAVDCPVYRFMETLFVNGFARIAVPLFFFISGFLFFHNGMFTAGVYKEKLKKRFCSLFVPYVFWNVVVIALTFLTQVFLSGMTSGRKKLVVDYTLADWLDCFWCNGDEGMPICYPFWFIRNLMILVLVSPLFYFIIKRTGVALTAVAGALWLTGITGISNTGPWCLEGVAFFSWGAYYGIKGKNFVAGMRRCPVKVALSAYAVIMVLRMALWVNGVDDGGVTHRLSIVLGLVAVVLVAAWLLENGKAKVGGLLVSSTFFVYGYHAMPAALAVKMWVRMIPPSDFTMTLGLFVIPVVLSAVGVLLYSLSARLLPGFTAVIVGGRKG